MITAGKHKAKVYDYGLVENDKGEPVVMIRFKFESGDTWYWTGTLGSENAMKRTLSTLITCGLKSDDLEGLAEGLESNMLDIDTEVECVLEESEYEGKTRLQIKYVNPIGGRKFGEAMDKQKAKTKFGGMNVKGQLAAMGFKKKSTTDVMPF